MAAPDCSTQTLTTDGVCLVQGMSVHQLLAYIAYQLAVNAGQEPIASNLVNLSRCLAQGMGDRQLLAAIAFLQCELAGV
jgi:hypothetical protein